jgi:uncharacterized SAM-binding protein YcdF (DUF218 family)
MDLLAKALGQLLTPPGVIVLVALLGFLIRIKWRFAGSLVVGFGIALLFVLSLPLTGKRLMMQLEAGARPVVMTAAADYAKKPAAIVVLGGGRYTDAPEYGADTVGSMTLERLRYAAQLHRQTGLPVLVSGGSPFGEPLPEAVLMQLALERDFQIKSKWVESQSNNTAENAARSKEILAAAGVRRIYLVTHAWHMPRALWAFVNVGLDAVPAPTKFTTAGKEELGILGYLPSAHGLHLSHIALRERLGLLWYKFRHDAGEPAKEKPRAVAPAK